MNIGVSSVLIVEVVKEEQSSEEHGLHVGVDARGEGEEEPGEEQKKEWELEDRNLSPSVNSSLTTLEDVLVISPTWLPSVSVMS